MFIVDSQIHLWTRPGGPAHHRALPYRAEEAVADMDRAGVSRAVNCPAIWDEDANAYAVEAASRYPARLATLGWFPLGMTPDEDFVADFLSLPGMLGLRFVIMRPDDLIALESQALDWIWRAADGLSKPVALIVPKPMLPHVGSLAGRFPNVRFALDHLNVGPFEKLPAAMDHLDMLVELAQHDNLAVKASAVPSMSNDAYPFADVGPFLERVFRAFGANRMFWGTDQTRMAIPIETSITTFTEHLPWLKGADLDAVMGRSCCAWLDWAV